MTEYDRQASILVRCDDVTLDMIQDTMGHFAMEIRKALSDLELDAEVSFATSDGVCEYL